MYATGRQTLWAGVAFTILLMCVGPVRAQAAQAAQAAQQTDDPPPAPVTLTGPRELPFSDAELQQALLARLLPAPAEAGPPRARVAPAGPGIVSVRVGNRTRLVSVGGRTGGAAARVVALVMAELLTAEAAPAAVPVAPGPEAPHVATLFTPQPEPVPLDARRQWRLVVTGGASKGTGSEESPAGTLDADLVTAARSGHLKLAASLGLTMMPMRNAGRLDEVSFVSLAARLLGGISRGPVDLLAGPMASVYDIGGGTTHNGFLFGGEVLARVAAPLSRSLRLAVDARVDGWANRVRVHWAVGGAYATPRVGIGIGAGVAWDWPS